jgi:hypothetical protein
MSDKKFEDCEECLLRLDEANEKAAALTTKQRKSMKKGTFCGPDRSFPVMNCKYVGVAKAYLKRSKFSKSTKDKIAACINRKSKQYGCKSDVKAKASEDNLDFSGHTYAALSAEDKKLYNSDTFKTTKDLVQQSIDAPDTI